MNDFCETIGIRYPIILGGMARVGTAPLAAAVSNAGGLGLLGASVWNASKLRDQIRQTRELTDKVFGVNITIRGKYADELADTVIEEKIPVVSTSAGNPRLFTSRFRENNIFVLHVVPTVALAKKADQAGVNAIIAEGSESGGMTSREGISTLALVPQVVDAVTCPVIAAGGIGDGRGMTAAMAMGAVGVQMGTVFLATEECEVSPVLKEMLILAKETDTAFIQGENMARRVIRDSFYNETKERLAKENPEILKTLDNEQGAHTRGAGQVIGLIREIRPVADLIAKMIEEANAALPRIRENLSSV
ncbi:NAD(P)H-dependent flavin oxidoreductase [Thermodesulfobacteriota bacterium]